MSDPLDLVHLRTVVAIADCGGFHRAAAALHLSQSTVSQHVRQLERVLDQPLVERAGRGARFTPAGEALLGEARRILAVHDQALARLSVSSGPAILLGCTEHVAARVLGPVVAALSAAFPGCTARVRVDRSNRLEEAVDRGVLDVAVVLAGEQTTGASPGALPLAWYASPTFVATPEPLPSPGAPAPLSAPSAPAPLSSPGVAASLSSPGAAASLSSPGAAASLSSPGAAASLSSPGAAASLSSPGAAAPLSSPGAAAPLSAPGVAVPLSSSGVAVPLVAEVGDEPWPVVAFEEPCGLRRRAVAALEGLGRTVAITAESTSLEGVLAAARAGLGVALLPAASGGAPAGLMPVPGLPDLGSVDLVVTSRRGLAPGIPDVVTESLRDVLTPRPRAVSA